MILGLEILSASSVNVSWDRLNTSLISGYIVYYSRKGNNGEEMFTNVSSPSNSVIIHDLMTDVEYQFVVVAVAEVDGDVVMGERSEAKMATPTSPPC